MTKLDTTPARKKVSKGKKISKRNEIGINKCALMYSVIIAC